MSCEYFNKIKYDSLFYHEENRSIIKHIEALWRRKNCNGLSILDLNMT